ncbi:MAG: cobalt-precorrin-5B (C(1))-methyltransferase CbiD [Cyanobacteria bacterium P01_A01_bin.123]
MPSDINNAVPESEQNVTQIPSRSGYTLPVFACASAIAALTQLQQLKKDVHTVSVALIQPDQTVDIPIEQVAPLADGSILAISRSDPGNNLDLTRDTPIWAQVRWGTLDQVDTIVIAGGEGIGRQANGLGDAAIYSYAHQLLHHNLRQRLTPNQKIHVTIILPAGRKLAERTSNAAFGVVEGLSLLGTSGIAQPLSTPGQLEAFRASLRTAASRYSDLVFCLGENGLDVALKLGIEPERRVKTANWIGPMLVEASLLRVRSLLLLGYHGKLIKLAGGIFHTHHHVADGRQEILAAHAASLGLHTQQVQKILKNGTVEASLQELRQIEANSRESWVMPIYQQIGITIEQRVQTYIQKHGGSGVSIGILLFDRDRNPIIMTQTAASLLPKLCYSN